MLATIQQRPYTVGPLSLTSRYGSAPPGGNNRSYRISRYVDGGGSGGMAPAGRGGFLPDITAGGNKQGPMNSYSLSRSVQNPWRPSTYYKMGEIRTIAGTQQQQRPNSSVRETSSYRGGDFIVPGSMLPPMTNSALMSRHTPQEWHNRNANNYMQSDIVRSSAERLRSDAVDLCRETDNLTKKKQREAGQRLGERIGDIHFWQQEINNEIDQLIFETNALLETKRGLEKALAESDNPHHISQECLYFREQRQGIDLVHDEVERELYQETDTIKACQDEMKRMINKMANQIASNRGLQSELERDAAAKHAARMLDDRAQQMRNTSHGITYHYGVEGVDNASSVPQSWAQFSYDNINRSQADRAKSAAMRNEAGGVYQSASNRMWTSFNNVNSSFTARCSELQDAKNKLQLHLSRVMQEMFDTERNMDLVKKAIKDKEGPLKVAQTRLQTRGHRPGVELCRDPAQLSLMEEVERLKASIKYLQEKLFDLENTAEELNTTRMQLEEDLARKSNSLFIDREKCMGMRKTFPMSTRISPF